MLLDREPPPGYLADSTARVAETRQQKLPGGQGLVLFRVAAEWLALPTAVFQEVVEMRPIHSLPHRQNRVVKGLVAIRGQLQICVSFAELLGLDTLAVSKDNLARRTVPRLLVTAHQSGNAVFPVDEVQVGYRYHPTELKPLPATVSLTAARFSRGLLAWRDCNVGVLDEELLFYTLNHHLA